MSTSSMATLEVEGTQTILPDAEGVFDAIARIGYEFAQAVADLVDNSVDAGAEEVLIRFLHDGRTVSAVAIIDDGAGMDADHLDRAMAFGARMGKGEAHLGKYGMGLKAASFSQCTVLTVLSRRDGVVAGRRWTAENVKRDWVCEHLVSRSADRHLRQHADRVDTSPSGTLVQWDSLDGLAPAGQALNKTLNIRFDHLALHLGLVFHWFIQHGKLRIRLDALGPSGTAGIAREVKALDPFPAHQARPDYPKTFSFEFPGAGTVTCEGHIWRRNAGDEGFRLGGGRPARRQGFYVYRNHRLIQSGGWNGLRSDTEVHTSLARVRLDIPPALDGLFKPTVQKTAVAMPPGFVEALRKSTDGGSTFEEYLLDAETAYRSAAKKDVEYGLVPREGINRPLTEYCEALFGEPDEDEDTVAFRWADLPSSKFFALDPKTNTITLNKLYRSNVLYGTRGSSGDAPLVKLLLMLLFREDLKRSKRNKMNELRLLAYNLVLVKAVQGQ